MKRTPLQLNLNEWPEELADYLKDAKIYDSSCSPEARVVYIDKDEGFFLKKAEEGALKTEARMAAYFHLLHLSAEVLYYGAFEGFDYLLTRRVPGRTAPTRGTSRTRNASAIRRRLCCAHCTRLMQKTAPFRTGSKLIPIP